MKYLTSLLCSLLLAALAQADTRIHVVHLYDTQNIQFEGLWPVLVQTQAKFDELGMGIKITRVTRYKTDPSFGLRRIDQQASRLTKLTRLALKRRWRTRFDVVVFAVSPMLDSSGIRWMGGLAYGLCQVGRYPFAMANQMLVSSFGEPRHIQSALAIAHEAGHIIGGKHTDGADMMNTNLLYLVRSMGTSIPWADESREQIYSCLHKRGKV